MKTVTVACTPEEALRYFTADFGVWWPAATHSVVAYASEFKDKPAKNIFWGKVPHGSRRRGCCSAFTPVAMPVKRRRWRSDSAQPGTQRCPSIGS